jgi:hypothetical protein
MASREMIWHWARTRHWSQVLIEIGLLLLFVLSSVRLLRH